MRKSKMLLAAMIITISASLAACGNVKETLPSESRDSSASAAVSEKAASEEASSAEASGYTGLSADTLDDSFGSVLKYIDAHAGNTVSIDYAADVSYNGRQQKYKPSAEFQAVEDSLAANDRLTKLRASRLDNGATIDIEVYRNTGTSVIDKIVSTEYGSAGRIVAGWYFNKGNIIYEYEFSDDLYGTLQNKQIISLDDSAEQSLMDQGYNTYDTVKCIPGYAKIYGYTADEYGGMLKSVYVTAKSAANNYELQVESNADGYYEFYLPVNEADWYNLTFTYGDFVPESLNDINICPGTTEYSCGTMYLAAKGENKHDTDIYLMNINKKSPDALADGEYEIVLSYDSSKAALKPYAMDLSSGKSENSDTVKINAGSGSDYKYYVTDSRNILSDAYSYNMGSSDASVTVYDKNGIVASYLAPAGHAGIIWEVFEIHSGKIIPVNNYYYVNGNSYFE